MLTSLILSIAGLGVLAWLVFNLAVYALPFAIGLWAALASYHAGAGPLAGAALGLCAGALLLAVGIVASETARSPLFRSVVGATFAVPAAVAGWHIAYHLAAIGNPAEPWRELLAVVGACVTGAVAWSRVSAPRPDSPGQGVVPPTVHQPREPVEARGQG